MIKLFRKSGGDENQKNGDDRRQDDTDSASDNESKKMTGKDEDQQSRDEHLPEYQKTYVPGRGIRRYNNSLKNLIPFRRKGKQKKTMGIDSAGLFSFMSMSWISEFMYKAHSKGLKMEELPSVSPYDTCDYNADRLELIWEEELGKKGPEAASFAKVAWRFSRTRIVASIFIHTCSIACGILSNTFLMRKLLEYVQSENESYVGGAKWALLMVASESARVLLWTWSRILNYRTALRLRSACLTLVYSKIIRIDRLGDKNIGEVINVFSNDAQRIFDMVSYGPSVIEAPISTVYGIWYILRLFSPMALLGMVIFVLYYPVQYMISRMIGHLQAKTVKISDLRVRLMNEILDCIKLIKMYAWEKRFSDDLLGIRKQERRLILQTSYCQSINVSVAPNVPVISTIITFLAHMSAGNNLTAAQAFPYSSFIDLRFRLAMYYFRLGVESIVSAGISFNRIKSLLLFEDRSSCCITKPILKSQAITISNATFAYNTLSVLDAEKSRAITKEKSNKPLSSEDQSEQQRLNQPADNVGPDDILFDISFEAEKGKLVGICGQVGSGKSSLLLAALGQLRVSDGQVMRDGSCAYVSQQAWITNATLRENILFGEKFDHSRYHKAIYTCNLVQDIEMMPGGDQTEIGEKGVNLSGGQKQRVALARALYADRDIYFLDDPLSAVDSRVGSHIFDNLILGALKGKTVLFVTHQIQYLNRCDEIYMMHDGRIIEHGTHDELIKLGNAYASVVTPILINNEELGDHKIDALSQLTDDISPNDQNQTRTITAKSIGNSEEVEKSDATGVVPLTVDEKLEQGTMKAHTYHVYIVAAGGYFFSLIVVLVFLINVGSSVLGSWWLATWLEAGGGNTTIVRNNVTILSDNINDNPHFSYYQTIYGCMIGILMVTSTVRGLVASWATIGASTKLHNDLFGKIVSAPMRFFDTTRSGTIQQLFSRDMDEVDSRLPNTLTNFIQTMTRIFFNVLVICMVFPWVMIPLSILATVYIFISKIFRVAIRDLKRMENISRSPVISFVTASVQGLSTIHAFGKEKNFMTRFSSLFDENSKPIFLFNIAMCYLTLRIDALTIAVNGVTAFLVVAFRDQVSPAFAGLALAYAAQISGVLPFAMGFLTETESRFISVERISHYIRNLGSEGGSNPRTVETPSTWPVKPEIKFTNVSMAYGEDGLLTLQNISFSVHAGERIGIVGRTGAGKTSLTVALFRLVELAEGKIEIDGVDISKISLSQLRTKLSIIPQDPVLFSGTIRSNLDPFKLYSDAEIWEALEKTELKGRVQSINGQLDASVGFGGDNMSVGERQLLCLARALLRNSKILILDEATAAVDPETEIAVQQTIQQEFSNCTILTIAHRLQTVVSLNRVLVMDSGKVLEFDTPSNLLADPNSEFSKMLAAAEQAESK